MLRRRVRIGTWILILGLVVSGLTAIPLRWELDVLARMTGAQDLAPAQAESGVVKWILLVREGLHATYAKYPFMGYGTDWLAFGHLVIAVAFVGALRHPVRNAWLFTFGVIASIAVLPWAIFFGELRGIPMFWRFIDCLFGIGAFIPCWLCRKWTRELEQMRFASGMRLD
jgi:hypothetical protein